MTNYLQSTTDDNKVGSNRIVSVVRSPIFVAGKSFNLLYINHTFFRQDTSNRNGNRIPVELEIGNVNSSDIYQGATNNMSIDPTYNWDDSEPQEKYIAIGFNVNTRNLGDRYQLIWKLLDNSAQHINFKTLEIIEA